MNKNLNVLQFVESSVRFNEEVKKIYFVQYYWLEIVKFKGNEKERFKYLDENSIVRQWYENVLLTYEIDMKYVRFFDIKNIYNKGEEMKMNKDIGNIQKFVGLKEKKDLIIEEEVEKSNEMRVDKKGILRIKSTNDIKNMNVAVVGSRGFSNYEKVKNEMINIKNISCLISGGANGADALAEKWADENEIEKVIIKPDYKSNGRLAPVIRNTEIVNLADYLIIFWDGKSTGTKDVINKCKKMRKRYKIINVDK